MYCGLKSALVVTPADWSLVRPKLQPFLASQLAHSSTTKLRCSALTRIMPGAAAPAA